MRLGISAKLLASFAPGVCLLALVLAVGLNGMRDIGAQTNLIADHRLQGLYYAQNAVDASGDIKRTLLELKQATDRAVRQAAIGHLRASAARLDDNLAGLDKVAVTDQERQEVAAIRQGWQS